MLLSEFDYHLPPELIAQQPLAERASSRIMVVDRRREAFTDKLFREFPGLLAKGDVLVLNNTKVFPARLMGRSQTGSAVEIFLVEADKDGTWTALARPAKRLRPGKRIDFGNGELAARIIDKLPDGKVRLRFITSGDVPELIDRLGRTPLPPYIKRDNAALDSDRERYQTVFARERGAIAAPTAGLHFSPEILQALREKGVRVVEITLHVGYGTFEPVRVDDVARHSVSPETYEIGDAAAQELNRARTESRRIVAVGTTSTRALEHNRGTFGDFTPGRHTADLTILPGYEFKAVGALLTNFHLPKSSLLVLISAFAGHKLIMNSYKHAVTERYRFYSYGDCMFIC